MRGEGNHKIPGSFAPENMEKTGAERVKYSLACQHEDAISIKFVSYAQKCPTVLCTFAVALRKESVDRNNELQSRFANNLRSLSARRAWIEIHQLTRHLLRYLVALRKESVDRNWESPTRWEPGKWVALRKESVDRNSHLHDVALEIIGSLSARRAWIEIAKLPAQCGWEVSLSARRAWIEIKVQPQTGQRNRRRSPQGERG